jgi:hypothetical protein
LVMSVFVFQSCGTFTDPALSNSPPYIKDYLPEDSFLKITPPVDSIMFHFSAADPDGDELAYSFALVEDDNEMIEVLGYGQEYIFKPLEAGFYHVRGKVQDHYDFAVIYWHISAGAVCNEPPLIERHHPDLDSISTLIGSTLEFRMEVEDDHPEYLRYSYYSGREPIKAMSAIASAECHFPETGMFDITGMVWDGEFGDTISWSVRVVDEPDTIAPAGIADLTGRAGADPGTILLRWTATGDDGMDGRAYRTLIRTCVMYIGDEHTWQEAVRVSGVPVPALPGTAEEMAVDELAPGIWIYASARAVDDFGNVSGPGNCIRLVVRGNGMLDGHITDAATGAPLEGIRVLAGDELCVSFSDGYYMLPGTWLSCDSLMLRDEEEAGSRHGHYDMAVPVSAIEGGIGHDISMMPYFDLVSILAGTYEENFYVFFRYMTSTRGLLGRPTVFRNWNHFPVTIFNPPFSWEGVDIQGLARIAISAWNDLTGRNLFMEVADPGDADVEIVYDRETDTKHHVETVSLNEDGTPAKKMICIYPAHQIAPIQVRGRRIFAHELGHILQLGHSTDLGHLMVGGTSPIIDDPSFDEINLVRALYGMPTIFDAVWYLDE